MDIEFGIQNVPRTVSFSTDLDVEEAAKQLRDALDDGRAIDIVDNRGRHIIVPTESLGYAIVGSDTTHPVGFGALGE